MGATNPHIRSEEELNQVKGRIVDGPSAEGFYTLEVPGGLNAVDNEFLQLRAHPELIRDAERVQR